MLVLAEPPDDEWLDAAQVETISRNQLWYDTPASTQHQAMVWSLLLGVLQERWQVNHKVLIKTSCQLIAKFTYSAFNSASSASCFLSNSSNSLSRLFISRTLACCKS